MFIFQAYAAKEEEKGETDNTPLGIRVRRLNEFLSAKLLDSEDFANAMKQADRLYQNKDLANFISSLTPGAQNAIHAASFAWGYENAAKYVTNAMRLDEVKNAADPMEKSNVVVQSMQNQAQADGQHEKITETSKFAWSYYNEDMKQSQAQATVSEAISEKESMPEREKQQQQLQLPVTPADAVSLGIAQNSDHPALIYCALAAQQAEEQQELRIVAQKKEEMARLVTLKQTGQKISEEKHAEQQRLEEKQAQDAKLLDGQKIEAAKFSQEAVQIALERKKELEEEYLKVEQQLRAAVDRLDALSRDDREKAEKIAAMLPSELSRHLLLRKERFAKRAALKKQLLKWIAVSKKSRKALLSMPLDRLRKLVDLSSLFR